MLKSTLLAVILIFLIGFENINAQSEKREVVTQATEWFGINSHIKLHKRFGLAFDAQIREVGNFESAQEYARLGLEIYLTPKLSIVPMGAMYVWNHQYGKQPAAFANNEQRLWQQVVFKHSQSRFHFAHRLRMEERFIQDLKTGSDAK